MKKIEKLCMVDDDEMYVFLAKKTIEQTQLVNDVMTFSNGMDALTFLKTSSGNPTLLPEVILLDLTMPVMDGWQFLEKYIRIKPGLAKKITIYIVSSSISPSDIEKAKSLSVVSDYVIKPMTKDKFVDLLNKVA